MTSKALALTAIGTQLILGLILVAILFSIQAQAPAKPDTIGCYHGTDAGWVWTVPCPS